MSHAPQRVSPNSNTNHEQAQMTVSIQKATPLKFTKSKNSDSPVSRYKFKWKFWSNLHLYRDKWDFHRLRWFRRCSILRGMCHMWWLSSGLLTIIGLFCKRALWKRLHSVKETYHFKEPTNRSHPISSCILNHIGYMYLWLCMFLWYICVCAQICVWCVVV